MAEKKGKGILVVLKEFFGYQAGQTLKDFKHETDQLNEGEKLELAQLVAKELGYEQNQVSFPLT